MVTRQWISEATDATFATEVLERSRKQPVLVDFWAPWCGPCRALTPALEEAITKRQGAIWLVKVNVDESPEIATRFQIQGVPAVKAFLDGTVVAEFVGARDRRGVEAFLENAFPSAEEQALVKAESLLAAGQSEAAESALELVIESPHHRDEALLLKARAQAARGALDEAEETLQRIAPSSPKNITVETLRQRFDLLCAANGKDESFWRETVKVNPDDASAHWALAGLLLSRGDTEGSLTELFDIFTKNRNFKDDGARKAMLSIFEEIGIHHELSRRFRRQMQIYL